MVSLPRFDYIRPKNLKETIRILSETDKTRKVLAGGTDLFVQMRKGLIQPAMLVDIKSIPQFSRISISAKGELVVGAGVTLSELEQWARTEKDWQGLSMAAGCIGSEQVRNRATVVGNVCRASPAGDMAPMLIAMDGRVEIRGPKGKKLILVEDFITGPGKTVLARGEVVGFLRIPNPRLKTETSYLKLGARRAMETAIVAVAVRITMDQTLEKIRLARIVLGAVAPTPLRVPQAEEMLMKRGVTPEVLEEISEKAKYLAKPITDLRGSESYRSEMVKVMTRRAIEQIWKKMTGKEMGG